MYENGIFVFGTKILCEVKNVDAVTRLPLELSWVVFSYLDDASLRSASFVNKTWSKIILANRNLRNRMNKFELTMRLGSKSLANFYRRNRRRLKKERRIDKINYVPCCEETVRPMKTVVHKSKRCGEDLVLYSKRYKLN
ncbi:uncharacterized protein LOC101746397 [Bombyx mori]|uniref:F-box domain-containing protein n=1 Tax=Bombyx mori TaxID=7091 RepID=A0A8R2APA5_BOMMO|nr:uncharacterized protein LOC101746397 [Bombyx mori]